MKKLGRNELRLLKDEIIYKYVVEGKSSIELAKEFNCFGGGIIFILRENGIEPRKPDTKRRKYNLDEHFFDDINTPEKAYVLGFIAADGNNSPNGRCVKICISDLDEELLEKIQKVAHNESPIKKVSREKCRKQGKNVTDAVVLAFNSKYLSGKIAEKGIVPNKSKILKFPNNEIILNDDLYSHYIRGYFDGDGSIYKSGNGSAIKIMSSNLFIEGLDKYLLDKNIIGKIHPVTSYTYEYYVNYQEEVFKFLNYIYKDATIYLNRKYERYQKFLEKYLIKNSNNI